MKAHKKIIVWSLYSVLGGALLLFSEKLLPRPTYSALKERLQSQVVPRALLATSRKGEVLGRLDFLEVIPNDYKVFPASVPRTVDRYRNAFQMKSQSQFKNHSEIQLYGVKRTRGTALPVLPLLSRVSAEQLNPDKDTLSILIDPFDLYDPIFGILGQPMSRGKKWERPIYFSFYKGRSLAFETNATLAVHGDYSRLFEPKKSFVLDFSETTDTLKAQTGTLLKRHAPVTKLILQQESRQGRRLMNPIALEIAKLVGGITPDIYPAEVLFNQNSAGLYFLTERLNANFFERLMGHRNLEVYRIKGGPVVGNGKSYLELLTSLNQNTGPLSIDEIDNKIDLKNLLHWYTSILFCQTTDAWQGPAVKNLARSDSKWFWVHWDMDESFLNYQADSFQYLLEPYPRDVRSILFRRLMQNKDFRLSLHREIEEALKGPLNKSSLNSLLVKYQKISELYSIQNNTQLSHYEEFFKKRPEVLSELAKKYLVENQSIPSL